MWGNVHTGGERTTMTETAPPSPGPFPELEDQLCLDLYVASRTVIAAYRALLAPLHLTYPQYLVILALWQHGPQSVKLLGERLVLDAGTLSPLLKRLEVSGYIRRERLLDDARELRVSLTPAGLALQAKIAEVSAQITCSYGLSAGELQGLQQTLRRLTAHVKTAGEPESG
ncbi:MarR family transcriptional regulator [Deinococcus metallilatus]|nr:MarR family transcriptional regulator [Deinococcus metallilatus]